MSVLIKNIEFPQKCSECDFRNKIDGYWYCGASYLEEIGNILPYGKADFCPLVEVPTPHGRLIDVDNISRITLEDSCYELTHIRGDEIICEIDAQTVIEAESEG